LIRVEQELKFRLFTATPFGIPNTGVFINMSQVPQGDTDNTRNGDTILVKSIQIKGIITIQQPLNVVRVIVFQWKPRNTPVAVITDQGPRFEKILLNGLGAAPDPWSYYTKDYASQYRILWDKTFILIGNSSTADYPNTTMSHRYFTKRVVPKIKKLQFDSGTADGFNQIFIGYISDAPGGGPVPTTLVSTRINYTDS